MARKRSPDPEPPQSQPPPLGVDIGGQFRRDIKLLQKRGKDMAKLTAVVDILVARRPLEPRYRDHALAGNLKGYRDCHIESDWVLIYRCTETKLVLYRTGTHSDPRL